MKSTSRNVLGLVLLILTAVAGTSALSAHEHGHHAPHGGSLSVIQGCGLGHVEVKTEGDKIELWFLDGGDRTDRSVPISEPALVLSVIGSDGTRLEGTLAAAPLSLAGEKPGRCSHFAGELPGLAKHNAFEAFTWVRFKGEMRSVRIAHPEGYDPDHGPMTASGKESGNASSSQGKTGASSRKDGHDHDHDDGDDCPDCRRK